MPVARANQAAAFDRNVALQPQLLVLTPKPGQLITLGRRQTGSHLLPTPLVSVSLGDPRTNGVAARLKLAGKIVRITASTDEVDHLSAKFRRIRWACSWHRQHLWQKLQGVHQTGSIPIPVLEILGETPVVSEPGIRCARQASGAAGRQSLSCRRCARRSRPPQDPLASDHELLVDFRDHSLSALAFPLVGLPAHPFRFWRGTVPGRLALAAELTV